MTYHEKCPACGVSCIWEEGECDSNTGAWDQGWFCPNCGTKIVYDDPPEPPEPDLAARSARETYIEAWYSHQRLHRR